MEYSNTLLAPLHIVGFATPNIQDPPSKRPRTWPVYHSGVFG